ncbi:Siroheme synthase [Listeria grayi]|uniref:uroporphyrinogen-III C-methyltransferase n=1 Tax=Listeria grayi FSL F6-1183 TaxID=1265827 RepID=A0A829R9H9_LISGR|nr:uroporphyrinogen-III C-methyltransferase [Listeria grayi]EUJ29328.1 methyltransferase/uroporphyrinogen-III synthase [Listeria grayi FSL F6-1183]VEI32377.1 Siroheme synthase [Listeria grayi]
MIRISLVGAGPGDPELLTIKGRRVIEQADVIIYDRLVNPLLLYLAKADATFIYCGKEPHKHSLRQTKINETIVEQALSGKQVVRLKGGDPAVFGRVGEEMDWINQYGIDYEVIPGITAASAASIYAGIPLTHREHCSHATLATGHRAIDGLPSLQTLDKGTYAFYMGIENLTEICLQIADKKLPVAVIEWGTLGKQKTIIGDVGTIIHKVKAAAIHNPAMILIGDVVKEHHGKSWFEKLPLFGKNYLLVSSKPLRFEQVTSYTEKGAYVWAVATADQRFDTIHQRILHETACWDEIVFLDSEAANLLARLEKRIGVSHREKGFVG